MSSDSIYLIDASGFVFRAYYALQPLSSKGRPSHAVMGFASMLFKLLHEHKPKSCVVVFDSKAPSFRKEIYTEYKANRIAPPPDLSDQIKAVMELCKAGDFPILQQETIEADDWIASFVRRYGKSEKIVIVSSDKDLTQLVNSKVSMFDSFRNKMIGSKEVREKWQVDPKQMLDYLVLVGDSSDNVPGVEGVGPKTAAKLLAEYGSISGIYKNLSKLPEKFRMKFIDSQDQVALSQKLIALKDDLEFGFECIPEIRRPFPKAMKNFLMDWDCQRLVHQYEGDFEGGDRNVSVRSEAKNEHRCLESESDLQNFVKEAKESKRLAFDVETNSFDVMDAKLVGVSLSATEGKAWYLPWNHGKSPFSEERRRDFLNELFTDEAIKKVAHNAKYDLKILTRLGFEVKGLMGDTMIAAHLLGADRRSFSLENLAREILGEEKGDLKKLLNGSEDFSTIELENAVPYACQDAALTWKLWDFFQPALLQEKNLWNLFETIEMPLVYVLLEMEELGIKADPDRLQKLAKEMHAKLEGIEKEIYRIAGEEFNINSPKQLQRILFEMLKLPPGKKTKTGYSTDESVLTELAVSHELPRHLIHHRTLSKLTSTYVDVLPTLIKKGGRIHTSYHQTGTATGRLSSSDPNLQNIPVRSEEGLKIREAFVAEKGFCFLSADYSQMELRLFAHMSGDEKMIEAFQAGRDIHAETAKIIFGSGEGEFRSRAKAINFGIIYGISAFGLSQQLGISRSDAQKFMTSYFEKFPAIEKFMGESIEKARKCLYSETLFGRKRPLPDIHSKNPALRQFAERIAINAPLQGTAADMMKVAMIRVFNELKRRELRSRLLLQVHDEILLEVWESEKNEVEEIVRKGMTDLSSTPLAELKAPLVADISFGSNWADV